MNKALIKFGIIIYSIVLLGTLFIQTLLYKTFGFVNTLGTIFFSFMLGRYSLQMNNLQSNEKAREE